MITLRRFTMSDWYALSGCNSFNDSSAPLIGTFTVLPRASTEEEEEPLELAVVVDRDVLWIWPPEELEGSFGNIEIRNGFSALNFLHRLHDVMSTDDFSKLLTENGFTVPTT